MGPNLGRLFEHIDPNIDVLHELRFYCWVRKASEDQIGS